MFSFSVNNNYGFVCVRDVLIWTTLWKGIHQKPDSSETVVILVMYGIIC